MAKKGQKFKKYSPEFKLSVILDMRENHLGYCETVRKYNMGPVETDGARDPLQRWEHKYLEEGYEGLMKDNRGRPPKLDKKVEELFCQKLKFYAHLVIEKRVIIRV